MDTRSNKNISSLKGWFDFILVAGLVAGLVLLAACSPRAANNSMTTPPTVSTGEISSVTAPPSQTATHTPTKILEPTATPLPSATPTLKPTVTPKPDVGALMAQAATEAGITFPDEVSSSYESPNGRYGSSISFSQALAEAGGFSDTEFSDEFMRRVTLDIFGHMAYASLNNHPRHNAFKALIPPGGQDSDFYHGSHEFIRLAQLFAEQNDFTFTLGPDYDAYSRVIGTTNVTISRVEIHFMTSAEYPLLQEALTRNGIPFAQAFPGNWSGRRAAGGIKEGGLIAIDGNTLHIYSFYNGVPGGSYRGGYAPMEQLGVESNNLQRLDALRYQLGIAEWWLSLFVVSRVHPNFLSVFTMVDMPILCAADVNKIDTSIGWGKMCALPATSMFK